MDTSADTTSSRSPCSHPVLRIGVILGGLDVPMWVCRVLTRIEASKCLELAAVLRTEGTQQQRRWPATSLAPGTALFKVWSRFDYHFYRRRTRRPDAFECAPVEVGSGCTKHLPLVAEASGMVVRTADIPEIESARLDVILDFGFCPVSPEIAQWARYGVWSLGVPDEWVGGLFRRMDANNEVLEARISIRRHTDVPRSITCSYSKMELTSVFRNCNTVCWKAGEAVVPYLLRLHDHEWEFPNTQPRGNASVLPLPGNIETLGFIADWFFKNLRAELRKQLFREHWFIAVAPANVSDTNHGATDPRETDLIVLDPPSDRFYADPFALDSGGKTYIFFEDFRFEQKKGIISYVEVDQSGRCSEPEVALERDYHLSYPCLFEWQGHVYLLPETKDNNTIELYRATAFPRHWQFETTLLKDVSALDSTILNYGGKFWLFTAGFARPNCYSNGDDELFLFFADSPLGPWTYHPKNPVISDVRRCRPAGQLFLDHGRLIRPAQDSSRLYGCAVRFNRVDVLSETDYRETPVATIPPGWFPKNLGTHTFNQSARYQVVDGRVLVSRFRLGRPGLPKVLKCAPLRQLFWVSDDK